MDSSTVSDRSLIRFVSNYVIGCRQANWTDQEQSDAAGAPTAAAATPTAATPTAPPATSPPRLLQDDKTKVSSFFSAIDSIFF